MCIRELSSTSGDSCKDARDAGKYRKVRSVEKSVKTHRCIFNPRWNIEERYSLRLIDHIAILSNPPGVFQREFLSFGACAFSVDAFYMR